MAAPISTHGVETETSMELIGNYDAARDTLLQNENSQLVSDTKQIHIKLPPKFLGNIGKGVKDYLTSLIGKQERLDDAYPIAYTNIKIRQALGRIISDQPCIHFDISADFILFKPEVGCKLQGKVNKLSKRHMGCLVHGCFNAWVPHTPVTETAPSDKVLGAEIEFTVISITTNRNILSVKGKFEKFLSEHLEKFNKTVTNAGKGKKNKSNSMVDSESHENIEENKDNNDIDDSVVSQNHTNTSVIDEDTSLTKKKKKHKKDKKKANELDMENDDANDSIVSLGEPMFSSTQVELNSASETKKHKKKRKKHDKSLNDSVCDSINDINVSGRVNGDVNLNDSSYDNLETKTNKQSESKNRKRKHSESEFTKIKEHVSDNSSLNAATPAKKHKKHKKHSIETKELESINNSMDDFVVGSSSSKKSKKKKKKNVEFD